MRHGAPGALLLQLRHGGCACHPPSAVCAQRRAGTRSTHGRVLTRGTGVLTLAGSAPLRHGALKPRVEVRLVWSSERSVTRRTIGSATGIAVLTRVRSDRKLQNERGLIRFAQSLKRSGSANEGAATRYSSGARNPTGPVRHGTWTPSKAARCAPPVYARRCRPLCAPVDVAVAVAVAVIVAVSFGDGLGARRQAVGADVADRDGSDPRPVGGEYTLVASSSQRTGLMPVGR
jgi:hypothetical protein